MKKCFSAGELPCSSFSLGSFTRGPAGASRRGAYPGPGMHPSAAVGVMASRGQRDRGAWVGGRRLQRRRACAAGVCGTACLGGRGDALQPRPAGAAGSSGGLTGSADPCLLALLYGGAAAYHPRPPARRSAALGSPAARRARRRARSRWLTRARMPAAHGRCRPRSRCVAVGVDAAHVQGVCGACAWPDCVSGGHCAISRLSSINRSIRSFCCWAPFLPTQHSGARRARAQGAGGRAGEAAARGRRVCGRARQGDGAAGGVRAADVRPAPRGDAAAPPADDVRSAGRAARRDRAAGARALPAASSWAVAVARGCAAWCRRRSRLVLILSSLAV